MIINVSKTKTQLSKLIDMAHHGKKSLLPKTTCRGGIDRI